MSPWLSLTCNGFVELINGQAEQACKLFIESLGKMDQGDADAQSHCRLAASYSYIGLAAYEAEDMKEESLRNFRRYMDRNCEFVYNHFKHIKLG